MQAKSTLVLWYSNPLEEVVKSKEVCFMVLNTLSTIKQDHFVVWLGILPFLTNAFAVLFIKSVCLFCNVSVVGTCWWCQETSECSPCHRYTLCPSSGRTTGRYYAQQTRKPNKKHINGENPVFKQLYFGPCPGCFSSFGYSMLLVPTHKLWEHIRKSLITGASQWFGIINAKIWSHSR